MNEIDEYTERTLRTKADLEKQLPLKKEELDDKLVQMREKTEELARNKKRIQAFFETREAEHKEYMEHREEMTSLINGLKEAKTVVS